MGGEPSSARKSEIAKDLLGTTSQNLKMHDDRAVQPPEIQKRPAREEINVGKEHMTKRLTQMVACAG